MKTVNHLGTDPIGKLVPRIAFPSMLAQFVSVLYSIVDRMYIATLPLSVIWRSRVSASAVPFSP